MKHANYGGAFTIWNVIENFVDFWRVIYWDLWIIRVVYILKKFYNSVCIKSTEERQKTKKIYIQPCTLLVQLNICEKQTNYNRCSIKYGAVAAKSYFNRMTRFEAVQPEGGAHALLDELVPYVVFWKAFVHTEVHDPRGEALVEPKVSPPFL